MLKVQIAPSTTAGARAGRRCGSVMWTKRCQPEAPSTSAASCMSRGIDSRAPSATTIMKGKPSQVLAQTLAVKEVAKSENQETRSRPSDDRMPLTAPYSLWNMPFQMSAVM